MCAQGLNLGGLGVALGNLRVPCGMASYSARIRDSFSERSGLPEETAPALTLLRWLKRLGRYLGCPARPWRWEMRESFPEKLGPPSPIMKW